MNQEQKAARRRLGEATGSVYREVIEVREFVVIRARCCDVAQDVFLPSPSLSVGHEISDAVAHVAKVWEDHVNGKTKDVPRHPAGGPKPALTIRVTFEDLPL